MKHKNPKATYRLRNWREYNRALVQRGSLTMWLNVDLVDTWRHRQATGKRGHPRLYTETAIVTMATLQEIYHLPLRQTEGLLRSLLAMLRVELPVPDYSTLSRRRATVAVALPRTRGREALHVVVDSTGVKVYGEGEWKASSVRCAHDATACFTIWAY